MQPNLFLRLFCGLSLILASHAALADDNDSIEHPYVAGDASAFSYKNGDSGSTASIKAVRFRAGSEIYSWLSVEGQFATSVSDGKLNVDQASYNVDLNDLFGLYLRPQIKSGPLTVYGVAGYTYSQVRFNDAALGVSHRHHDQGSSSYGIGGELSLTDDFGVSADYMHYVDGLQAVSVGLVYHIPN